MPAVAAALAAPVVSASTAHAAPKGSSARVSPATSAAAKATTRVSAASLLKAAPSVTPVVTAHPTLDASDRGGAVRFVQRRLGVRPSGKFGLATVRAVARFQKASGLAATGTVDSATWRALGVKFSKAAAGRSVKLEKGPGTLAFGKMVLATARQNAGGPYRYGGTSPKGFDCSGFVGYVYRQLGISLPRSSGAMKHSVKRISASEVRPGDLVFVNKGGHTSHVAIYAGNGYWYEASRPGKAVGKNKAWTSRVSYGRVV